MTNNTNRERQTCPRIKCERQNAEYARGIHGRIAAEYRDRAASRLQASEQMLDQRGFADTVLADQTTNATRRNLKADATENIIAAVAKPQVLDVDDRLVQDAAQ